MPRNHKPAECRTARRSRGVPCSSLEPIRAARPLDAEGGHQRTEKLPNAFWHIRQWQTDARPSRPTEKRTAPH